MIKLALLIVRKSYYEKSLIIFIISLNLYVWIHFFFFYKFLQRMSGFSASLKMGHYIRLTTGLTPQWRTHCVRMFLIKKNSTQWSRQFSKGRFWLFLHNLDNYLENYFFLEHISSRFVFILHFTFKNMFWIFNVFCRHNKCIKIPIYHY